MSERSVLVTGGAGFIGSAFVRHAVGRLGWRVVNLDLLTYAGSTESLSPVMDNPRHVFVQGDIRDQDLVASLLREHGPAAVIHLAAQTHVDRSIDAPDVFVETNVLGTQKLLVATLRYWRDLPRPARDAFRFVNVSTDEVYGSVDQPSTEDSPYAPNSPYAASKAAADHLARTFFVTYGLPTITTHSSNNYGPYQFPEKLIPLCLLKALRNEPVPIYGDGLQVRDWLHVEDHCAALIAILQRGRPGEVYNIGAGAETTNLDLVKRLLQCVDEERPRRDGSLYERLITFVEDRPGHDRRYSLGTEKIRRELGWSPSIQLEEGLKRTVAWYLDNSDWMESVTHGRYDLSRLGLR